MIRFLSILVVVAALAGCASNGTEVNADMITHTNPDGSINTDMLPVLVFEEEVFDFGTIAQGEKVTHFFQFKNEGKSDLIITSARGSCGCTVPTWPKEPLAPGERAEMKVVFDSDGKSGRQHKTVTLVANTQPSTSKVAVKGEVVAPSSGE